MRRSRSTVVAVSLAVVLVSFVMAPAALAGGESRDFRIRSTEYKFQSVPAALKAGIHDVSHDNHGDEPHVLLVFRLNAAHQDDTKEQILIGLNTNLGGFSSTYTTGPLVGRVFSPPGTETTGRVDLSAGGRYVYFCPIPTPTPPGGGLGVRHFNLGMVGFVKTQP